MSEKDTEKVIKLFFIRAGIRCDFLGYTYLVEGTKAVLKDPELIYKPRKLYQAIEKTCQPEFPKRIAINIQNAINYAESRKGFDSLNKIYGAQVIPEGHHPSTEELIELCANYIRLGLYKKNVVYSDGDIKIEKTKKNKKSI